MGRFPKMAVQIIQSVSRPWLSTQNPWFYQGIPHDFTPHISARVAHVLRLRCRHPVPRAPGAVLPVLICVRRTGAAGGRGQAPGSAGAAVLVELSHPGIAWRWMEMGATERSQKWAKMLFMEI